MDIIIDYINKENLSHNEKLQLIEELYWADWGILSSEHPEELKKVFEFLRNSNFNEEEMSLLLKLYSNPEGAYVEEFSFIITKLYKLNKAKFIKALSLNMDEAENIAYLFRNNKLIEDGETELAEILATNELNEDEVILANRFFKTYKNVCNT